MNSKQAHNMIDQSIFYEINSLSAEYSQRGDIAKLRLKYPHKQFAIDQIEARHRHAEKLPSFISNSKFLFPTLLSGEQASNQWVAQFNASFVKAEWNVTDLTSGLGIDAISMAQRCRGVMAFDMDEIKVETLINNTRELNITNLTAICADSIKWLETNSNHFDMIFIDPARRSQGGGRVSYLEDCQPDIVAHWDLLLSRADRVMVKASPMLDITDTLRRLSDISSIYAVCFKGECKEVLVLAGKWEKNEIAAIDLSKDGLISEFSIALSPFNGSQEISYLKSADVSKKGYLYIPGAGMMKIAAWKRLQERFPSLLKLDVNTHIFYSDQMIDDFPGRRFQILDILDKKGLKRMERTDLNVISRNYPMKAEEIEKRYRLVPRGNRYLIVCKVSGKTCMFYTELI